jgi:hypothetical protein
MENMTLMREALWHDADEFLDIKTQQWNQPRVLGKPKVATLRKILELQKMKARTVDQKALIMVELL